MMRLRAGVLALLAICAGQAGLAESFRSAAPSLKATSRTDSYLATAPALAASTSARNYMATAPAFRAIQKSDSFRVAAAALRASVRVNSYLTKAPALRASIQADMYWANAPTLRVIVSTDRYSTTSPTLAAHALAEQGQKDSGSVIHDGLSDLLCPDLLQCFTDDLIRTVENDMATLGYTPESYASFCADIAQSLGHCPSVAPQSSSNTTEDERALNDAAKDFHLFRCIPLETYAIDLQQRTDAGEDTNAEEQRLVALVSAASNHMFTGRTDLWCDQITAGLP